jgi:transcriptional regulator with XRE-family HTH domain
MENLKRLRIKNNITQEVIAEYIGCTRTHYALMETDKRGPQYAHLTILPILDRYAKDFDASRLDRIPMPIVADYKFNLMLNNKKTELRKLNLDLGKIIVKLNRERSFLLYTDDMQGESAVVERLEHTLQVRLSKERLDDFLLKYQNLLLKKVGLEATIMQLEKYVLVSENPDGSSI